MALDSFQHVPLPSWPWVPALPGRRFLGSRGAWAAWLPPQARRANVSNNKVPLR